MKPWMVKSYSGFEDYLLPIYAQSDLLERQSLRCAFDLHTRNTISENVWPSVYYIARFSSEKECDMKMTNYAIRNGTCASEHWKRLSMIRSNDFSFRRIYSSEVRHNNRPVLQNLAPTRWDSVLEHFLDCDVNMYRTELGECLLVYESKGTKNLKTVEEVSATLTSKTLVTMVLLVTDNKH